MKERLIVMLKRILSWIVLYFVSAFWGAIISVIYALGILVFIKIEELSGFFEVLFTLIGFSVFGSFSLSASVYGAIATFHSSEAIMESKKGTRYIAFPIYALILNILSMIIKSEVHINIIMICIFYLCLIIYSKKYIEENGRTLEANKATKKKSTVNIEKIINVIPDKNFNLLLEFESGIIKRYNIKTIADRFSVYEKLKDEEFFKLASVSYDGSCVSWNEEIIIPNTAFWEYGKKSVEPKNIFFKNKKYIWIVPVIVAVICTVAVMYKNNTVTQDTKPAVSVSEEQENSVYITQNGKRYHKKECRTISSSNVIKTTEKKATNQGYTPCSICNP